jgi:hypothetical protein
LTEDLAKDFAQQGEGLVGDALDDAAAEEDAPDALEFADDDGLICSC